MAHHDITLGTESNKSKLRSLPYAPDSRTTHGMYLSSFPCIPGHYAQDLFREYISCQHLSNFVPPFPLYCNLTQIQHPTSVWSIFSPLFRSTKYSEPYSMVHSFLQQYRLPSSDGSARGSMTWVCLTVENEAVAAYVNIGIVDSLTTPFTQVTINITFLSDLCVDVVLI